LALRRWLSQSTRIALLFRPRNAEREARAHCERFTVDFASVVIDNRPTYRQAEPEPVLFGREERIEQSRPTDLGDAWSQILYLHAYSIAVLNSSDRKLPAVWSFIAHGVRRIHGEIEDDLLQLGSITEHRGQISRQLEIELDLAELKLTTKELNGFTNDLSKINRFAMGILVDSHVPDARDDIASATSVSDDPGGESPHFVDVRRFTVEPPQACLTVDGNRSEWLVHLVGN
jgi:hypothetical protein